MPPLFRPGERVGERFTVEELVGSGGMSEVYRCRDSKLSNRSVAVKALRPLFDDAQARNLVLTELQSLSRLNHPHIAVLHDVCRHNNVDVIVMEFVHGETLAHLLLQGPLHAEDALRYAIQIAGALAYAHKHGVIHRDIKPSNIVVTAQGAKLLDFGLATLTARPAALSRKISDRYDSAETSLVGTPFYMSPEQQAGKEIDQRTDIYSFGLVFAQMYTAFSPQSDSGLPTRTLIAGILQQMGSRQARVIAAKCLASDPDERWSNTSDLHYALAAISEADTPSKIELRSEPRRLLRSSLALGLVAALALLVGWLWARSPSEAISQYQFAIAPPAGTQLVSLENGGSPAISPDGKTLAFIAADRNGDHLIWLRRLDASDAAPLTGTAGASHLFWSPDSRSIAFFVPGRLLMIPLSGGSPRFLADAPHGRGGAWSNGGVILFTPDYTDALYRVADEGGVVERVTTLDRSVRQTSHRWPFFLPDGRRFLFFVRSDRDTVQGLYLGSLDLQQTIRVGNIASSAVYATSGSRRNGYLVFEQRGVLVAQRFRPLEGQPFGPTTVIAQLPAPEEDTSLTPVSVSLNGVLVYRGGSISRQRFVWADRAGRELGVIVAEGQYRNIRLSPDSRRLAIEKLRLRTGLADIWFFDLDRDLQYRAGPASGATFSPVWSADGKGMLFASYRGAEWDLLRRNMADETDIGVLTAPTPRAATDWSTDGKWIIYQEQVPGTNPQWDIGALDVSTRGNRKLINSPKNEHQAQLSPDGSWLAFTSDESGTDQVYIQRFFSNRPKVLVSSAGGSQPRWHPSGGELFYLSANNEMMSVSVNLTADPPVLSPNRLLFSARIAIPTGLLSLANYDVDPKGRFLIATPHEQQNFHQQINVMVNAVTDNSSN
jgi:serine/threonine protein kinase